MTAPIAHRGPDDFGYLLLNSRSGRYQIGQRGLERRPADVCLGHRRLAIIDLSSRGRQPIQNETGEIFLVFNGEIFNYIELRHQLVAKGHVFRSRSDTEVVVHAYEEWGADCVAKFNGMWAFAIWDQRKREIFCSRDRFGIKPFYYFLNGLDFLFASEIKGLLPAVDASLRADYGIVKDYLLGGAFCRNQDTFFKDIKRLEPSHNLVVSAGRDRRFRYWNYDSCSQANDFSQPVESFRSLLDEAVKLRLRSDVPVGVALSGGLDSTSVLACAARHTDANALKTFTAVFPGEHFNEYKYARLASDDIGARHFCLQYEAKDFIQDLRHVTWCLDYPAAEGQVILRWQLMRMVSRHVKVILEGQGADEMLAGYIGKYFTPYLMDQMEGLMRTGRPSLRYLFDASMDLHRRHGWPKYDLFLKRVWRSLRTRKGQTADIAPYNPDFLKRHPSLPEASADNLFKDRLTRRMHFDHAVGMLPLLLKYGDALSMASSIESRLPFLDHRLVEFVFALPADYKLDGSLSKVILRRAMAGEIPDAIRSRKDKIGFETPIGKWINHCLESGVRPLLLSRRCKERGIFDMKQLDKLLDKSAPARAPSAFTVFRWMSVELWFRIFIDGEGAQAISTMGKN